MSRRSSWTHTACRCMVVLSGTSLADSLLPWRLPLIIFSGEFGDSQETATLEFCIKLHILIVFSIDFYVYLTVSQERPVSRIPICFMTPLPCSTPMCLLQLAAIATVLTNMWNCILRKTLFVPTLQDNCTSVTPVQETWTLIRWYKLFVVTNYLHLIICSVLFYLLPSCTPKFGVFINYYYYYYIVSAS